MSHGLAVNSNDSCHVANDATTGRCSVHVQGHRPPSWNSCVARGGPASCCASSHEKAGPDLSSLLKFIDGDVMVLEEKIKKMGHGLLLSYEEIINVSDLFIHSFIYFKFWPEAPVSLCEGA